MRNLAVLFFSLVFVPALAAQTVVNVDAAQSRRRIDPRIYGTNFATQQQLLDLNAPLNRNGGNAATRYNWEQNASNRAHDWFYESLPDGPATAGDDADKFIAASRNGGSQPMITIPIIGWVAKLGPNRQRLASFSVAKYGPQQQTDWQWFPDAGNGVRTDGTLITNNDAHDANMPADPAFQRGWLQHLTTKWGTSANGGVRYYMLDNEYSIWHSTHRDVKPQAPGMDEVWTRMRDYAEMIKSVDPNAMVVGPEEWGWTGYFWSGADQQWASRTGQWWQTPDRIAHGGMDYLPWLLTRFHNYELEHGKRLLDVFSVHYYPQGGEYSNTVTEAMQLRRNRSTRSLWDPNYTDETWINDKVRLVPRLKTWADYLYPGTPVGLTEYSWGADEHINGATAQADVLGILGREGMDIATRWVTPPTNSPAYNAMKMYRNYDGNKSVFGDISVRASGPNPDQVAAFAAVRSSDRALTIMLINKQLGTAAPATINVAGYSLAATPAKVWQLTSANAITQLADVALSGSSLSLTLPAQSITLVVLAGATDVVDPAISLTSANGMSFSGTASDDIGVARVEYRLTGATTRTGTASGTTSFSASIGALNEGITWVQFIAYDAAGNNRATPLVSIGHKRQEQQGKPPRANPERPRE